MHTMWVSSPGLLGLAFVICCCLVGGVSDFNFEIAKRTQDNIRSILSVPRFPCVQALQAYNASILDISAAGEVKTRELLYTQIKTVDPNLDMIYVGSEDGMFIGFFNYNPTAGYVYTFLSNGSTVCPDNVTTPCRRYYSTNNQGIPTNVTKVRSYDPRSRPWYIDGKTKGSVWSSVYTFATTGMLGITFATPLYDINNDFIGVAGADFELGSIDNFLYEAFNGDSDQRVVFIMELNGNLIASSVPNVSVSWVNGSPVQVKAIECSDEGIKSAASFLATVTNTEDILYVHNGVYIQSSPYTDEAQGLEWHVVVTRPAQEQSDHVAYDSASFYAMAVISILVTATSVSLIAWVFHYRKLQLWRIAQPEWLVMILVSNIFCALSAFVLAGPPSDGICLLRQWWISLSITLTCAAFLAKIMRVLVLFFSKKFEKRSITSFHVGIVVTAIMLTQVVIVGIWSAIDPMKSTRKFSESNGRVVEVQHCTSSQSWGLSATAALIAILFVSGCVMSYIGRNVSELFAESRGLMVTFYHGAFITAILFATLFAANVGNSEVTVFISIGMCWFAASSQVVLFAPRVYRQVQQGDFTPDELREIARQHFVSARKGTAREANL